MQAVHHGLSPKTEDRQTDRDPCQGFKTEQHVLQMSNMGVIQVAVTWSETERAGRVTLVKILQIQESLLFAA